MGVVVALAKGQYPVSVEAMSDSIALGWDRETAVCLMEQYSRLAINSMEMVAGRFWELQNRYRELATERVEQRLAHAVLRLSAHYNGRSDTGAAPIMKLSRQDLAEMTGTTLFSVSRICSDWEQRGILATGREQIRILNRRELETIAEDLLQTDS
jgi:CRP-like cAMP-binding protein